MSPGRLLPCVLLLWLVAGCRYELVSPPHLPCRLRVSIAANNSRLVRSQAFLHEAVARSINRRLGWDIHPLGEATLHLIIAEEQIRSSAVDVDDIPNAWQLVIRGKAVLDLPGRRFAGLLPDFQGIGTYTSRDNEMRGLQRAAENAAAKIADWLELNGSDILNPPTRSAAAAAAVGVPTPVPGQPAAPLVPSPSAGPTP